MYCPNCGKEIQEGLNYCNRCGKRLAGSSDTIAQNLSNSAGAVGVFGFVAYIFVMLVMVKYGVDMRALVMVTFFYMAGLFAICFLLIRQAGTFVKRKPAEGHEEAAQRSAYLKPVTTARLEEPREIEIGSVTDHTTRTLEEVPVGRK